MNENFFGKYSVFCVFGSVVGCVLVPLVGQILQQQSMECMILLLIFVSIALANFKKDGSDSHHSKLLLSKDYDRKKYANNTKKQKSTNTHNNNHHGYQQQQQQHHKQHDEQEYMQQHEHLRILENEKRNEEKRLKKQKKREERLKRKEEESKRQKEKDEKYKALKEKRRKQQSKQNTVPTSNPYHHTVTNNFEKYCCGVDSSRTLPSHANDRRGRTRSHSDENRAPGTYYNVNNTKHAHTTSTMRQNIPRFNNNTTTSSVRRNVESSRQYVSTTNSEELSINCSSLSASCSSLSSISSSGSASPPPPTSPNGCAWKTPYQFSDSDSTKSVSPHKYDGSVRQEYKKTWSTTNNVAETEKPRYDHDQQQQQQQQRVLKSYTNVRPVRSKLPASYGFSSSSLFCSNQESGDGKERVAESSGNITNGGEYSLFGSHQFGNSFIKSPII